LRKVEEDAGTSVPRIAADGSISDPLVWGILLEESLHPYILLV
jgi:hypothetical protein